MDYCSFVDSLLWLLPNCTWCMQSRGVKLDDSKLDWIEIGTLGAILAWALADLGFAGRIGVLARRRAAMQASSTTGPTTALAFAAPAPAPHLCCTCAALRCAALHCTPSCSRFPAANRRIISPAVEHCTLHTAPCSIRLQRNNHPLALDTGNFHTPPRYCPHSITPPWSETFQIYSNCSPATFRDSVPVISQLPHLPPSPLRVAPCELIAVYLLLTHNVCPTCRRWRGLRDSPAERRIPSWCRRPRSLAARCWRHQKACRPRDSRHSLCWCHYRVGGELLDPIPLRGDRQYVLL